VKVNARSFAVWLEFLESRSRTERKPLWTLVEAVTDPEWFAEVVLGSVGEFFGYRYRDGGSTVTELGAAHLELEEMVERVVALARFELERIGERGLPWWSCRSPREWPAWVWSRPRDPGTVLEELARRLPEARAILGEGLELRVARLLPAEAERRLAREVSVAVRQLTRVDASARRQSGGEVPTLDVPSFHGTWRGVPLTALVEPVKRGRGFRPWAWLYTAPEGWENTGPWGGSLQWLAEQPRPASLERCDRCNWHGRFPWLVGVDDGRDLQRLIERAHPNSTGARLPLLPRYRGANGTATDGRDPDLDPIDHMDERRDRACALCGGRGYIDPLDWNADARLRQRSAPVEDVEPVEPSGLLEAFDERGRLRPLWDRQVQGERLPLEPSLGIDTDLGEEERRAEAAVGCGKWRLRGEAAIAYGRHAPSIEGAGVAALQRSVAVSPVLESLALRQFLADTSFDGAGRVDGERRASFLRRDAVVFELVSAGFPVARIAAAIGVSEKRVYALDASRIARQGLEASQRGAVRQWHEQGYEVAEIARATGLPRYTVRRIVRAAPAKLAASHSDTTLGQLLTVLPLYARALMGMGIEPEQRGEAEPRDPEEFMDGPPIDYFRRWPPGMPLYGPEQHGDAYHTYLPSAADGYGGRLDPANRSLGVLHPFFHALLSRACPRRMRRRSPLAERHEHDS
jgi:hypothetical protein